MAIVDINGDPLTLERLEGSQIEDNSQVGMLLKQYATHPSQGLTPAKLATLLAESEQGNLAAMADLAKDMEDKDAHLLCEIGKRRRALLGLNWQVKPPRNPSKAEEQDADRLSEILEDATWFTDLVYDLSDGILKGFAATELQWDYIESQHVITGYEFIDQNVFTTPHGDHNNLRLNNGTQDGEALNAFGWALHTHRSKSGYVHRAGLATVLAWPFLFKNYSIRDLAEFLEIYGLPLRLGKYPSGASQDEKNTLLKAVLSIGHNAGGIIPRGMDIEFQNAAQGQSDPFEAMIRWCEQSQSKAILGGTLTSQADGKSSTNALGNIHMEARKDLTESDARQLEQTLTRDVLYPMHALSSKSYSGNRRIPRLVLETTESEDIAKLAPAIQVLVETGVKIPQSWANEKLQIPVPDKDEPILRPVSAQSAGLPAAALSTSVAALTTEFKDRTAQQELDTALNAITSGNMRDEYKATLQPLLDKLNQSEELAAIELAELYPSLDQDSLTEMLTKLFFVSELWGMINE
ncbi:hypothetical protein CWB99_15875 [Pseudoalteromonas rubra]|uniref:Mu-like prophage FluMu protein gp29 n=1 Tax=Pseudoalteromonas rubra TaxID=43658 RepID=A0A5S3WIT7_9GAMM|nr:DUF935 domain-containing protein [Pseudoalteromonas rubra]TMP27194.1 hypothetical protein CWB99_15875 [Pseudoalteromonas rubra]TMP29490.1 hypothetical protein CWC00_18970 [Pseudoalteromonas rubra]